MMREPSAFEPDKWPNTSNFEPIPEIVENGKNRRLVEPSNPAASPRALSQLRSAPKSARFSEYAH
jgi:hypothetical protein